jgi:hypothetical protein
VTDLPVGAVTTADIYRKLEDISGSVIRMEERVRVLPDFESRLRLLERFRYTLLGAAIFAGSCSGVLAALVTRGRG